MKIHFDKIIDKSVHGLSANEARIMISAIPPEWQVELEMFHFSNALDSRNQTWLDRSERKLVIYSRNRKKRDVVEAILTELYAHHLGLKRYRWDGLSEPRAHRIRQITGPLSEQIYNLFPKPKPNPIYPMVVRAPYEKQRRL